MVLDATQGGMVIEQRAPELLRIWRLARATARPHVFPGLLDGIMGHFFEQAGRLLAAGAAPEEAWSGLTGLVRLSSSLGTRELTGEWAVAMEVLSAACESFDAAPQVGEWLARAVAEAEKGTSTMAADLSRPRPAGVVVVVVHGEMQTPRRRATDDQ